MLHVRGLCQSAYNSVSRSEGRYELEDARHSVLRYTHHPRLLEQLRIVVKRRREHITRVNCDKGVVDPSGFAIRTSRVMALRELAGFVVGVGSLRIVARTATPAPRHYCTYQKK
jgi:hypothetical protein